MVRNNIYCRYKGKEYRFVHKADGSYQIVTEDKKQIDSTFILYQGKVYCKNVSVAEIDEVYSINSYAVYNGDVFVIIHDTANEIVIGTNDEKLAHENKMTQSGKYEYRKTVSLSEVEVFEEQKEMKL